MLANYFFTVGDDIGGTDSTNLTVDVLTNDLNVKNIHHTHKNKLKKKKHFFLSLRDDFSPIKYHSKG